MNGLGALKVKRNSPCGGVFPLIAALSVGVGLSLVPVLAEAAQSAPPRHQNAKVEKLTKVAAKDAEETGSIETDAAGASDTAACEHSRKRLFVEGEGWIVRKVTTCY